MSKVLPLGRANPPQEIARLKYGDATAIAVQQKPQVRKTYWDLGSGIRAHHLAFPYLIFIATFYDLELDTENFSIYYSNRGISTKSSMLFYPNLCNVYDDCRVCLGDGFEVRYYLTMKRQAYSVVEDFWSYSFTSDLMATHFQPSQKLHPNLTSLPKWAVASRKNRDFILRVDWRMAYSLKTVMERSLGF